MTTIPDTTSAVPPTAHQTTLATAPALTARRPWRLPLVAALALAFVALSLISGIAYIVVLAGATNTAERLLVDRTGRVVEAQT